LEWTVDRRLRLTWARGRRSFDLGMVPSDLVGMRVTAAFGRIDSEITAVEAHVRALDGESVRCRIRWGTRILETEIRPQRNTEGDVIGAVAAGFEVAEKDRTVVREVTAPAGLPPPRPGRTPAAAVRTS
jgi:hypothetical protein